MIKTFACKETLKIWEGDWSAKLPHDIQKKAKLKLGMLNQSRSLKDLMVFPNSCLEKLKGKRPDEYSIRINDQWRICFQWNDNNAYNVSIEDYH